MIIVDDNNYATNKTFTVNTIFNGITEKNIYINSGVAVILEGICQGNVYLSKNSYCEVDGIVEGDFIYGEGTFEFYGLINGEIRKN